MKLKLILFIPLLLAFIAPVITQEDPLNIELLGQYDDDNLPSTGGLEYNDVWGYSNEAGEFAIVGGAEHILFIDVTDPSNPTLILQFDAGSPEIWRDFKTYTYQAEGEDPVLYIFGVCDSCTEGLHVFTADGATVTHEYTTTEFFPKSHNIFIDEENHRLYAAGVPGSTDLIVIDISDPTEDNIGVIENIDFGSNYYVHDVFVKDNIAYCNHGWTGFQIWDLTDPANPDDLGYYDTGNYNHSCWITKNDDYIIFAEEVGQGLPLGVVDLENMGSDNNELNLVTTFQDALLGSGFPTPHNPFIKGDTLYVSYYEDGLKMYDVADPENPVLIGHYDTHINGVYTGTEGNWGTYPFLPSGNILATDINNGLFVLRYDEPCEPDLDEDGYCADVDCDDNDPNINPGVPELCDGIDNNCNGDIDDEVNCVSVKTILTGPYKEADGLMSDEVKRGGYMPLEEPYSDLGYIFTGGGGGEEITDLNILMVQGDNAIVDWVVLELRSILDNTDVVYSRAALIQRDGNIVDVDGVSRVDCSAVDYGLYYIAVRHRNHLGVMSDDAIDISGLNDYDFTDESLDIYGTDAQFEIDSGIFGMWPGNANMDDNVKYNGSSNDKNDILGEVGLFTPNNVEEGYLNEDVNMDGFVKYNGSSNDKNTVLSSVGLFTPNNIIFEQIPD